MNGSGGQLQKQRVSGNGRKDHCLVALVVDIFVFGASVFYCDFCKANLEINYFVL